MIVNQQTVRGHQHHVLHTGHAPHLLGYVTPLRRENREKQNLRGTGRHLRQHRRHIGVPLVHRRHRSHRAPQLSEGIGKSGGQTLRIRIAVVNGGRYVQLQLVFDELGYRPALEQVVVGHPVITLVPRRPRSARQIGGQSRGSVGGGNHHQTGVRNQRGSGGGRPRTGSADHPHHLRVGHDLLRRRLTPVRRTQIIQPHPESHIVTFDGTEIFDSHLGGPLIRNTQKGNVSGDSLQRPNLDFIARGHLHRPQRAGFKLFARGQRFRRSGGGGRVSRRRSGGDGVSGRGLRIIAVASAASGRYQSQDG